MRKLLLIIAITFFASVTYAQGVVDAGQMYKGKYTYSFIFTLKSHSSKSIHRAVNDYLDNLKNKYFTYGKPVWNKDKKEIIVPINFVYEGDGICIDKMYFTGDAIFSIKDEKCRMRYTNFKYRSVESLHDTPLPIHSLKGSTVSASGDFEQLFVSDVCKSAVDYMLDRIFEKYRDDVHRFHTYLRDFNKNTEQDYW